MYLILFAFFSWAFSLFKMWGFAKSLNSLNVSATEFTAKRKKVGYGPSNKTDPR